MVPIVPELVVAAVYFAWPKSTGTERCNMRGEVNATEGRKVNTALGWRVVVPLVCDVHSRIQRITMNQQPWTEYNTLSVAGVGDKGSACAAGREVHIQARTHRRPGSCHLHSA